MADINFTIEKSGSFVVVDKTLKASGVPADAKTVGDRLDECVSISTLSDESNRLSGLIDNANGAINEVETLESAVIKRALLEFIYPVGSVYMTMDDEFEPSEVFGGTWERIEGKFIRATFDELGAGDEGGSNTHNHIIEPHVLTSNEIPPHTHGKATLNGNFKMNNGVLISSNSEYAKFSIPNSENNICSLSQITKDYKRYYSTQVAAVTKSQRSKDVIKINASHTHNSVGGGLGHDHESDVAANVPEFICVNIWKRIANAE